MTVIPSRNQTQKYDQHRFNRLMARYRSRVYETGYAAFEKQKVSMEQVIQNRLDKPTILVVEDNVDDWFLIRYGLGRQFPGAECVWLPDAAGVVPYLDQYQHTEKELPRLIVLDLYLPSARRGMTVLQSIKSHSLYQSIPTVVFSHSPDPADVAAVLTCSADAYVIKPTEAREWQRIYAEFEPFWKGPALVLSYPQAVMTRKKEQAMISLHVQSTNQQHQVQRYHCLLNQLDEVLTMLSLIAAAGNTLSDVYIIEDGHRTNLPPQAFDGNDMSRPIRALQADWLALLSQPILTPHPAHRQLRLELTLQRIDQCETLMGEYFGSISKLEGMMIQTAEVLREGPQRSRLLTHYRGIVTRQYALMEKAETERDTWLKKLTELQQV